VLWLHSHLSFSELTLVTETLLSRNIKNLFTYAKGYEVRVSLYFAKWKLLLES